MATIFGADSEALRHFGSMSPRGALSEGESRARNYLQTLMPRAQPVQIKNPAGIARYVRELFGGDGSKTGVGVVETPRAARCCEEWRHEREPNEEREREGEERGQEERRCLAVARTRARSVVMSAGGQAADYYHCMNMNETRRRTRTKVCGDGEGGRGGGGGEGESGGGEGRSHESVTGFDRESRRWRRG